MIIKRMKTDRNGCSIVARIFAVFASMSAMSPRTCRQVPASAYTPYGPFHVGGNVHWVG